MQSTLLLDGWTVAPKRGLFDAVTGTVEPAVDVRLPHDAMLGAARSADAPSGVHGGYYSGGAVEYHRELHVDRDVPGVHRIVFDGVYRDAVVFVNDQLAAQCPGGYRRFVVDLDPYLDADGRAELRVEARAHRDSRWYTGLGIHRSVTLWTGPLVHVDLDGITVTAPDIDDDGALAVVESRIVNVGLSTRVARVETVVSDPDGREVARGSRPITLLAGETGVARERLWIAGARRWDLDDPALHSVTVTVTDGETEDAATESFGIRRLQLDAAHGLRINGRTVKLRGACLHHDNGLLGARTLAAAEERRIRLLKDAGFTAIRSAHNPASPELLDACDRLGMIVMDEAFDTWGEAKSAFDASTSFLATWEAEIDALVAKDRNHPSVVFYSIGNEIPETGRPSGARLSRLIAERVHRLDPSRFTTNGINGLVSVLRELPPLGGDGGHGVNDAMADMGSVMSELVASDLVSDRTEEALAVLDAAGLNYGDARYLADAARFPNRVIVGTETFSTRIDLSWPLVVEHPHLIGDFTWTGWDYLGEAGIGRVDYVEPGQPFGGTAGPYPWRLAWCGDLDITGWRRPVSYYREIVFGLRRDPYLAVRRPRLDGLVAVGGPWSWSDAVSTWTWDVSLGTPVVVEVYGDADEVELFLDEASLGTAPLGRAHRYRAEFEVAYAPGELIAIARRDGAEVGRHRLTSGSSTTLRITAEQATVAVADGLVFVAIEAVDEYGAVVPLTDVEVALEVEGSGELLALGSARPDSDAPEGVDRTTLFDGRAQAVICPLGPGSITIRAASPLGDGELVVAAI